MMKVIDWKSFGELIKEKRAKKNLTQAELAKVVNLSQPAISFIERGSPVGISSDEKQELLLEVLGIASEEIPFKEQEQNRTQADANRTKVFISYSHKDKPYLDRLSVHLRPLERAGITELWVDTRIMPGEKWRSEIEAALAKAQAAVLLISADFLASNFILENELPPLLEKAEKEGVKILPVILKPCRFTRDKLLSQFQAVNMPENPISGMSEHESELVYDAVAQHLELLTK